MSTQDRSVFFGCVMLFISLFALAAIFGASTRAQTDGSQEGMRLQWTAGPLPSLSGDGESGGEDGGGSDVVEVSEVSDWANHHAATRIARSSDFRHIRHMGGPQGCVFTADSTPGGYLKNVGGGRDCPEREGVSGCGYISEGWLVFALAGASCEQFGIPRCQGPFCY